MSIAKALQALQTAKTDIANAIVAKNGVVNSGDGFSDFAACIGTIPQGSSEPSDPVEPTPSNFELHKITLSAALTASNSVLMTGVQFIKDHINDTGFTVAIIALTPPALTDKGIGFVQRGNRPLTEKSGGYYYGAKLYTNGSSSINQLTATKLTSVEWNGFPNVDSTGKLFAHCNTSGSSFMAGDYLIMLAVLE